MSITLSKVIDAPVEDVFAFFDDPASTLQVNEHAVGFEVINTQPDGRRTFDVVMRAGAKEWMQTIEQIVREPPTRLTTRSGTWSTDRDTWLLTVTTDRHFSPEAHGTRVEVTADFRLDHPFRRPFQAISNWLHQGDAAEEFESQLDSIAEHIEGRPGRDHRRHDAPA